MERLYPRELLECIREGRSPLPEEIEIVATRISREAFPERPCMVKASLIARAAMSGVPRGF